jgi:hypothetical protein
MPSGWIMTTLQLPWNLANKGRGDGIGLNPTNVTKDSYIICRKYFLITSTRAKSVVPLNLEEVRPSETSEHLITTLFRAPKRSHHLVKYLCGSLENYSIFLSARLTTNTKTKIRATSTSVQRVQKKKYAKMHINAVEFKSVRGAAVKFQWLHYTKCHINNITIV